MPRQEHGQVTTRSADRRQAILVAAYELFIAEGFDRTSISAIVAKVGGSKGTIYAYFGSKEKLFVDCMFAVPDYALDRMRESLDANDSLTSQLRSFGEAFLRVACAPDVVAVRRLMISEAERGGIGRLYFERFQSFQDDVASFIATYMARGNLRDADPGGRRHAVAAPARGRSGRPTSTVCHRRPHRRGRHSAPFRTRRGHVPPCLRSPDRGDTHPGLMTYGARLRTVATLALTPT